MLHAAVHGHTFYRETFGIMKKIWKFLSSMQFAIILLLVLAAACAAGSFISQGQTYDWYAQVYGERWAAAIIALHLDDAYHSWWFLLINAFLCLNLLFCNLVRLPQLIRRYQAAGKVPEELQTAREVPEGEVGAGAQAGVQQAGILHAEIQDPGRFFPALHMPAPKDEGAVLFAQKNRIGLWGAWVCHLGILLLILGFSLGQATKKEYVVYGVPGQTKTIGDTGLALTIDDFLVDLREDETVNQYTAKITVYDVSGTNGRETSRSAEISVNHPADLFGLRFYQNSTGWAARMHITKDGNDLQDAVICAGEYLPVEELPELVIYFNAFYPDLIMTDSGPQTVSSQPVNPGYLYSVYYQGKILGMNVLHADEELKVDDYVITFSEPQNYTLIQVKKDSYTWLAFLGGIVTMLGLVLAFYLLPARAWVICGEDGRYTAYGESRKGGAIFRDQFFEAAKAGGMMEVGDERHG